MLSGLIAEELVDRIAMDIKNSPEEYAKAAGADVDMSAIERSKELLLCGSVDYEFRTTVVRGIHTRESLVSAAKWIAGAKEYYLQQFKDSGDLILPDGLSAFDEKEMLELCEAVRVYVPAAQVRGV